MSLSDQELLTLAGKAIGILDISTFQRQCEAARNKETGMV